MLNRCPNWQIGRSAYSAVGRFESLHFATENHRSFSNFNSMVRTIFTGRPAIFNFGCLIVPNSSTTSPMPNQSELEITLLRAAYAAFNARDIDAALALMTSDVGWPRAFKGGFVVGLEEVRDY